MVIYKITNNINNKVYIGQTQRSFDQRIREHIKEAARDSGFYIHAAIRKYGWNNFSAEIIAEAKDVDELNYLELKYIQEYDSIRSGYNLAPGGYSNCMSSESVKSHHDEVMRSPDVRAKISESMKKRIRDNGGFSDEHRKHVSEGLKRFYESGKRPNYKHPQKLSPEHYKALNDAKNKSVYCIDHSGNIVAEFPRVKDAAEWWLQNGYVVKSADQLCDKIKESSKYNKFIKGLKWIYRV